MTKSYLSPDEIEKAAQTFLKKYHPENTLPIPIEEIIEFQLKIDIIPTPDMMDTTGVDAVTSHDLTQINIDRAQLESRPNRARFTLAHEVGHIVLHKEFIKRHNFQDEKSWRKFVLNDLHRDPMEVQANMFAAFVLIPSDHLRREYELAKSDLAKHPAFKTKNLPAEKILAPYLAEPLAQKFETSEEAMTNRLINWIQKR
jgi:hypothetical protein